MERLARTEVRVLTEEQYAAHVAHMKALTGSDGKAPRSARPKVNVRELVEGLK